MVLLQNFQSEMRLGTTSGFDFAQNQNVAFAQIRNVASHNIGTR